MYAYQLDLFAPNDEVSLLKQEIAHMHESLDKQRRAQFAKIHELSKELIQLKEELHKLRFLCSAK